METDWNYHGLSKTWIIYVYITVLLTRAFIYGQGMTDYVSVIEEGVSIDSSLPGELQLRISQQSQTSHMKFVKSSSVSVNVPVFTPCDNGTRLCQDNPDPIPNFAVYYDLESGSIVSIKTEIIGNETGKYYEGVFYIGNEEYVLKADVTSPGTSYRYYLEKAVDLPTNPSDVLKDGFDPGVQMKPESPVLKDEKPFLSKRERVKRRATVYGVELLVVIDYKIYQTWYDRSDSITHTLRSEDAKRSIRQYFTHVVNGMDLRYRAIQDNEMQIYVRLAGYVIADTSSSSYWAVPNDFTQRDENGRYLFDAQKMLSSFNKWMTNLDGLPAHDHAVLFTGHNLYTASSGAPVTSVTGLAFLGRICSSSSVSVVEDHGGFSSTQIATHELGHSLGASHDGDHNSCPSDDQYIMAGQSQPSSGSNRFNQWRFSPCSIQDMKSNLFQIDRSFGRPKCLANQAQHVDIVEWTKFTDTHPGQLFHLDDVCRQRLGTQSYICRDLVSPATNVCTAMWCHITGTNQCRQFTAPRGTSCGNKKWCIDGLCVFDSSAPCNRDECVFGDQPGVVYEGKNCEQLTAASPWACYNDLLQLRCCTSCHKLHTGIPGCEYGNRQSTCPDFYCNDRGPQRDKILSQCCKTCHQGGPPVPTSESVCDNSGSGTGIKRQTIPPSCFDMNEECAFMIMSTPSKCSNPDIKTECCAACYAKNVGILSACLDSNQCQDENLSKYEDCSTTRIKKTCCYTCAKLRDKASPESSSSSSRYVYSKLLAMVLAIGILHMSAMCDLLQIP